MLSQILPSIIRTVVPLLVALVTSLLVKAGIDPGPYQELLAQLAGALVATAYYAAIRIFETYVKPRFGWLLGYAKQPSYDPPAAPSESSPTGAVATEGTVGIPEGDPVDVIPAGELGDASVGDPLEDFGGSARAAIEAIAHDGLNQPYAGDTKVDAALHGPTDGPAEDYTPRH